ncbi:MAG: hypothetical protein OXS47_04305 [Chloroflexota bacterium]|nr:hypothetical protein [Chloroflexota bacterium]
MAGLPWTDRATHPRNAVRDEAHEAECAGVERGACYLRRAFVGDASVGSAALAAPVIDRWYGTGGE